MGVKRMNPLPTINSEAKMAEVFADYFQKKIKKIRDELDH